MLSALKQYLRSRLASETAQADQGLDEQALKVATAALLVEMSRADFSEDAQEREAIHNILQRDFALAGEEAQRLLDAADAEAGRAVSLHEFTSLLHAHLSAAQKSRVVETLWEVALADGRIDKYEDYLVRKVADLLYLPAGELVRLKHVVLKRQGRES